METLNMFVPPSNPNASTVRPGLWVYETGLDEFGVITEIRESFIIVRNQNNEEVAYDLGSVEVPLKGSAGDLAAPEAPGAVAVSLTDAGEAALSSLTARRVAVEGVVLRAGLEELLEVGEGRSARDLINQVEAHLDNERDADRVLDARDAVLNGIRDALAARHGKAFLTPRDILATIQADYAPNPPKPAPNGGGKPPADPAPTVPAPLVPPAVNEDYTHAERLFALVTLAYDEALKGITHDRWHHVRAMGMPCNGDYKFEDMAEDWEEMTAHFEAVILFAKSLLAWGVERHAYAGRIPLNEAKAPATDATVEPSLETAVENATHSAAGIAAEVQGAITTQPNTPNATHKPA